MRSRLVILLVAVLFTATLGLGYLSRPVMAQEMAPYSCAIDFEATVRQGPDEGLSLIGELQFEVDETGTLTGAVVAEDGTEVPVAGQVNGRAINLVFDLGEDQYIYGVGTALHNISDQDCGLHFGGPFAGPQPGDMGDWISVCIRVLGLDVVCIVVE